MPDILKTGLPANPEIERYVLASVMLGSLSVEDLQSALTVDDFSVEYNRTIYQKILELHESGTSVDRATLADSFYQSGKLENVGGLAYLIEMESGIPALPNMESYVKIVKEKSILRRTYHACNQVMNRCLLAGENPSDLLAQGERLLSDLNGETAEDAEFVTPVEIIEQAGGVDAYFSARRVSGVMTPWEDFNRITRGLQPGHLAILAARTSKGKSAMAANIAVHAARNGVGVALFSLEMDRTEVNDRLLAIAGNVRFEELRGSDHEPIRRAVNAVQEMPIHVRDMGGCSVPAVLSKIRKLASKHPIGLVIVDYLQLMSGAGKYENRTQEVSQMSRGLKMAAQDLRIPFLVLSQLRRSERGTPHIEPALSDLRESGSIEQDANLVCFIHAEQEYSETEPGYPSPMKLIVAKQRNGPTGQIEMLFHRESGRFSGLAN